MNPYKPAMMGWDFPFSNLQPHLSSEKIQVICLYLGDDKLPSYIGIFFISQYMDPREPTSNSMECHQGFVSLAHLAIIFSIGT